MEINSLDFVFKHSVNRVMQPNQHIFEMYSEDKSKKLGTLVCHKSELPLRPNYDGSVLAIDFLLVNDRNKGTGTKILKFAEDLSRQMGCKGYMTLKADGSYTPNSVPHIFYRKFGFSAFDKKTDKKFDKFIRQNRQATWRDFPNLLMHYPPAPQKHSFFKEMFCNLFKFLR